MTLREALIRSGLVFDEFSSFRYIDYLASGILLTEMTPICIFYQKRASLLGEGILIDQYSSVINRAAPLFSYGVCYG